MNHPFYTERIERTRGVDGYERPTLLPPEIMAVLENRLVTDNGKLKVRPGFDALGGGVISVGYTTRIQGLAFHERSAAEHLVAVCNQAVHRWDGSSWGAAVSGWTATSATSVVQMVQMDEKLYFCDGTQTLYEFDGTTFTQLNGADDPAAGASLLVFHSGRLFAAGWSGTGATAPYVIRASNLLAAGTGQWKNPEFVFQVGGNFERVRAMVSMPRNYLLIFKDNSIYTVNADPQAASASFWLKEELTLDLGCVGPRAAVRVGNDCWFWSQDGIRSVRAAAGTEGAWEIAPPVSQPLQSYVDRVNNTYKHLICAWRYREYVFFSVPLDSATTPSHTFVFNTRLNTWMGVWSGVAPTCWATTRFSDIDRLVCGDSGAKVNQWKDLSDQTDDRTYTDNSAAIATTIRTKSWHFNAPDWNKSGDFWEILFDSTYSVVATVKIYYDGIEAGTWDINEDAVQNELPLELPFDLAVLRARRIRKDLDDLGDFREAYLEITTTGGNVVFLTASMNAFHRHPRDEA